MGILSGISSRIAASRKRSKDKKAFFADLLAAANDGRLTDEEIAELQTRQAELGLTADQTRTIRVQAYKAALSVAASDGKVTAGEEAELHKLQTALAIADSDINASRQQLARMRLLTEIQLGNLPGILVPNLLLQKTEIAHWSEPGSILEERVVGRRYVGGSQGVSFRIARGVSYRIGAHRGHVETDKAIVPVSDGDLVLTNKRVIFRGNAKSFTIRLDKLLDVQLYNDGVRLTEENGKSRTMRFKSRDNVDVIGAVLSRAIDNFGA
jgi:hypothetical protein